MWQYGNLRMKKIDLETIYPQAEKDREGEKLRRLCDIHVSQRTRHADGLQLIDKFVSPRRLDKLDRPEFQAQVFQSHQKTPDSMKFLKALEIKVQGHADKQYQSKEFKGDYTGVSFGPNQMGDENFLFGQKGEILFSNDGS